MLGSSNFATHSLDSEYELCLVDRVIVNGDTPGYVGGLVEKPALRRCPQIQPRLGAISSRQIFLIY